MQIQMMKLSEIHPYEKNPRFNDGAVEAVANSIKEFGFQQPIVVDKDLVVVVGHTRLKAAEQLGLTEVPVVIAENLTPEQVQAYRIADNKTGEIAEWNYDLLPIELRDLQEKDFDLSLLGFDTDELDRLLNGSSEENVVAEGETDADAVPDVPEEPVSQPGVIYQLGKHRLMCGDSTRAEDIARLMNGGKADLVFTDPPYGVSYRGVNNPGGRLWEVIENDDLRGEKLSEFLLAAFKNLKASLREKRAFYIWYATSNHVQRMEKKQIEVLENGNVRVTIPLIFKIAGGRTRIFTSDSEHVEYTPVQLALARAFRWQKMIDEGKFSNIKDLAATVGVDSGLISRAIRLTLLSPKIIHKLLSGELDLSLDSCRRSFPDSWAEQEKVLLKSR